MVGRTITLKVRFSDFTTITRSRTLRDHTDLTPEIYATAADVSPVSVSSVRGSGWSGSGSKVSSTPRAPAVS